MRNLLIASVIAGACSIAGAGCGPPVGNPVPSPSAIAPSADDPVIPPDAAPSAESPPTEAPALTGSPEPPNRDSFYTAPTNAGGRPGDLLRYRSFAPRLDPAGKVEAPAKVWQVLYRSTDAGGKAVVVSGTVAVPKKPWSGAGERPIVSYGVGTHGLADRCAASHRVATGTERGLGDAVQALRRGWAVAVTDYEGLGTPGDHTYGVHIAEGRAALDVLRAAPRLPAAGLSAAAPVAVWGYSQGGAAAASAGEQAKKYAPELKLAGVAAGGVPADLRALIESWDGTRLFGLVFAGMVGLNAAYPELGIPESLTPAARALFERTRESCDIDLVLLAFRTFRMTEIGGGSDPLGSRPARARLAENRVGGVAPGIPVRLYHAGNDEFIPPAVARTLFADYCRLGATVQFQVFPGRNHGAGAADGAKGTLNWLADRFAGKAAPTSCG